MEALKTYLKEVRLISLLTAEQEVELSKKIKKGDERARKAMIRANLRLVINIAKRYYHLGIPLLDLIEEGNLGLMKAVDKFNHLRGYRFSTYAAWWIRQGIIRAISQQGKMVRLPVYMNERLTKWKKTSEVMSQRLKRVPTDQEIAKKMKISVTHMEEVKFWLTSKTSSLEAPIGEEDESQVSDLVEDEKAVAPDAEVRRIFDKERITDLLGLMTVREKVILDMRFGLVKGKTHTLREVAKKIGVSRERIRQIEEGALRKLRSFVKKEEIR
ncbi:MAG: sigma-70 family RNA polymerase sigma factor [Candidatus Omnitrophica bacterium]|nr:sigma-70 family RNA polymerase sigma factor [Candidatus Omnitrophota bacterium]MBU1929175.1 sigma-70 family RNA polymerase sigma factor [Candidatus Omnitrophota bacterium]